MKEEGFFGNQVYTVHSSAFCLKKYDRARISQCYDKFIILISIKRKWIKENCIHMYQSS